ncbi:uncharacterized protein [Chelonus insularis]|uniref:uncharacterized protein n=1 Tax=Chelonus insularis TaxID=460826 RepID=UPI00158A15F9|nr:uncharacterized protein LOC118067908 [Chelonus insularis]
MRQGLKSLVRRPNTQVAVSLGTGSVLLVGSTEEGEKEAEKTRGTTNFKDVNQKSVVNEQETQGLVQLRTVDRDEALVDVQETSCYVLEGFVDGDSSA